MKKMQENPQTGRKTLRILPPAPGGEASFIEERRRHNLSRYRLGEVDITGLLWRLGDAKRRGRIA